MTIMTTTFIPCGAKMPIIGLIAGALFGGSTWGIVMFLGGRKLVRREMNE